MALPSKFRFRSSDTIGAPDAEADDLFLRACFVDTGDITRISDCADPRRIVLGRTGSGKTALLKQLASDGRRVIPVAPESLALPHITNSTILRFLAELNINPDPFFKLLWRHVFAAELIRAHFDVKSQEKKSSFLDQVYRRFFQDKKHRENIEWLEKYGPSFWEDTENRVKEYTEKVEQDLKAKLGAKYGNVTSGVESGVKLTMEERQDIVHKAQHVINNVQISALMNIIHTLDELISDHQKPYYLVIDRLDENWVDDQWRLRLIRALIDTARDFYAMRHAKVIIALRVDLLERVYETTRDPGFQREKYDSLNLWVGWTRKQLQTVLNRRINHLVEQRYTNQAVVSSDVLPPKIGKQDTIDYMIDRTLMRPRDIIQFFNACIRQVNDVPTFAPKDIQRAEGEYSRDRLNALYDEWYADYPSLKGFVRILERRPAIFSVSDISDDEWSTLCLDTVAEYELIEGDPLIDSARPVAEGRCGPQSFKRLLLQVLYKVGLIGLKLRPQESIQWCYDGWRNVSTAELTEEARVNIHRLAWRALGVNYRDNI